MVMKLPLVALIILAAQAFAQRPPSAPSVFSDSVLSFQYTPPPNLKDFTRPDKRSLREKAEGMCSGREIRYLLSLRSRQDDTADDWHAISVESYPSAKVGKDFSDRDAALTFSRWVVNSRWVESKAFSDPDVALPTRWAVAGESIGIAEVRISDSWFFVSNFELKEGSLTTQARVYTTVLNGQVLSFRFFANSLDALNRIVDSIKSFNHDAPSAWPTRIEVWTGGDDGFTQRLRHEIEDKFKSSCDFALSSGKKAGTLIVTVPTHVSWTTQGTRTHLQYEVEFSSRDDERFGKSSGSCWEDNLAECAAQIYDGAQRAVGKLR